MSSLPHPRGLVYRCNVCGSEVSVLAFAMGAFEPVCCNAPMLPAPEPIVFYRCEKCGAEIAVIKRGPGEFAPKCCNQPMALEGPAAA
jgi:desulfoferrodoxin-like iron-binding protein